ncbi:hypothetical protein LCGC14_3153190, partial [marine sediment metagenome]
VVSGSSAFVRMPRVESQYAAPIANRLIPQIVIKEFLDVSAFVSRR